MHEMAMHEYSSDQMSHDNETNSGPKVSGSSMDKANESDGMPNSHAQTDKLPVTSEPDAEISIGMRCDVKNLYQSEPDEDGDRTWTEKYPSYIEEPSENSETLRYALIIRNRKSRDSHKKLEIDSIIVQSPVLKKILGTVLDDYPGVTTGLDRLEFDAPFEPFVHRWERLEKARKAEHDPEAKSHLDLLWSTLEFQLRDTLRKKADHVAHGVITIKSIWTIFEPGCLVFMIDGGRERLLRFTSGDFDRCDNYILACSYVDWDGERFGMENESIKVSCFKGTAPITGLRAYPIKHHPRKSELKERLTERGRVFKGLKGYHYKLYKGIGIDKFGVKYNVDSRIVIDTDSFNRFNSNSLVRLNRFEDQDLSADQLLMCSAFLRGYSLKDKKWLRFWIDSVKEMVWNDKAFESLVLPSDQKELILAFAESQAKHGHAFDDVVKGKGKGIIMLLSGPPGVGKTLTAESVAETMQVPLYMLSAGDLGTDPSGVEDNLSRILALATKWQAVLLLDEADVFLEARSAHDLERNKLVSIFLRILEYYEGFLFLTTNRVDNIDAAFESRIHLSLQYEELSLPSRHHVWKTFLSAHCSGANGFSEEHLHALAAIPMNGRQIKNVIKTAQLLASRKGVPLSFENVEVVTKLRAANARSIPRCTCK